jgi:transposase
MEGSITWVGIDAHKKTLAVAVLSAGSKTPEEFTVDNTESAIRKLARRLTKAAKGKEVRACYEAGTCGFTLQRRLETAGVVCEVIAPSLIPRKPGERFKTDRRDALKLAELSRAGVLTSVSPPTLEQEAMRDLCRCREAARADLHRVRHRLIKMLVRRGLVFDPHQRLWSVAHRRWLNDLVFENPVDQVVVAEFKQAIEQTERRLRALDKELEKAAELPLYRDHVAWLRCFRGIDTVVAMIFVAELHGIDRFESPRALAAYLGLVPSLHASGDSSRHGRITKTGNGHIRRALVQACWHYRHRPNLGVALRKRREGQPERVVAIAENAERRLSGRYARLTARGKHKNKIVIAIARELVGFLWAVLREDREAARHGARTSTQTASVEASAAPRSGPQLRKTMTSKTAVGQRRTAR